MWDFLIPPAYAHEKWFVAANQAVGHAPAWYTTLNTVTMGALAVGLVLVLIGLWLDWKFEHSGIHAKWEASLIPLRDFAAIGLSVAMGIMLIWSGFHAQLLAPNIVLPTSAFGAAAAVVEIAAGACLILGLFATGAAWALIALYAATFLLIPFAGALEYVHYLGIGIFLLYFARMRYSLDWLLGKPITSTAAKRKRAYLAMRVLTGVSFIVLSFLKLLQPEYHYALLAMHPTWNPLVLLQDLGFKNFTRESYVFALFCIECLAGIFVVLGLLTRVVAIALIPVFTISIFFLGPEELVGHLPIVAILFVLFVFGDIYHKREGNQRQ